MKLTSNVFSSLNKWAQRQDENFVTEAFSYVLKHCIIYRPSLASSLLSFLSGGQLVVPPENAREVLVIPHPKRSISADAGYNYPDIELKHGDHCLVYLEAKVKSECTLLQFRNYENALQLRLSRFAKAAIVYATRRDTPYYLTDPDGHLETEYSGRRRVFTVKWLAIADHIKRELASAVTAPIGDLTSDSVLDQFVRFLREKGADVTELETALNSRKSSVASLMRLINDAADASAFSNKKQSQDKSATKFGWKGFYLWDNLVYDSENKLRKAQYTLGFHFSRPYDLIFSTLNFPIAFDRLPSVGEVISWHSDDDDGEMYGNNVGVRWRLIVDLDNSDQVSQILGTSVSGSFFHLDKAMQANFMSKFVGHCLAITSTFRRHA